LEDNLGVKATLIPEGKGIFDVRIDGDLIYSKYETGRFPDNGEITRRLK